MVSTVPAPTVSFESVQDLRDIIRTCVAQAVDSAHLQRFRPRSPPRAVFGDLGPHDLRPRATAAAAAAVPSHDR